MYKIYSLFCLCECGSLILVGGRGRNWTGKSGNVVVEWVFLSLLFNQHCVQWFAWNLWWFYWMHLLFLSLQAMTHLLMFSKIFPTWPLTSQKSWKGNEEGSQVVESTSYCHVPNTCTLPSLLKLWESDFSFAFSVMPFMMLVQETFLQIQIKVIYFYLPTCDNHAFVHWI